MPSRKEESLGTMTIKDDDTIIAISFASAENPAVSEHVMRILIESYLDKCCSL